MIKDFAVETGTLNFKIAGRMYIENNNFIWLEPI